MDIIEIEATSQSGLDEMDDIQSSSKVQGPVFGPRKTKSFRVRHFQLIQGVR
jgi:hypothetical protein